MSGRRYRYLVQRLGLFNEVDHEETCATRDAAVALAVKRSKQDGDGGFSDEAWIVTDTGQVPNFRVGQAVKGKFTWNKALKGPEW